MVDCGRRGSCGATAPASALIGVGGVGCAGLTPGAGLIISMGITATSSRPTMGGGAP